MKCHGCFNKLARGLYCTKCKKELFGGTNVKPLNFDKEAFYKVQSEMAGRLSISGVQDKISLTLEGPLLVPTATDGRYILKPVPSSEQIEHRNEIAANEHLSMQLSKQVFGINTASSALIPFKDGELAYITKRFDYTTEGLKLDQEDFASVLSYTENSKGKNYKYEGTHEEIANAIKRYVSASIPALEEFYLRTVFNYLIANGDAHLKNFSLYRQEKRKDLMLTPSYDLLYTGYHINEVAGDMALSLFENDETRSFGAMGCYTLEDFEAFAKVIGLPQRRLAKIYSKIISSTPKVIDLIERSFLEDAGKEAYINNYTSRLKERLCYVIGDDYSYDSTLLPVIEKEMKLLSDILK